MDNKIITMFEIVFDDIDPELNLTVMCRNNDQLFDNNLQIFDQK